MGLLEPSHIILLLILLFGIFFSTLYIKKAVFGIAKFLKYQRAQTYLLIEIAKKQQVDNSIIEAIRTELNSN